MGQASITIRPYDRFPRFHQQFFRKRITYPTVATILCSPLGQETDLSWIHRLPQRW